ncbi:Gfo/Idh/MocA family oxidoreductase [Pedobacter sp. MC2016-15]|uniref:Gfo/Idh/MocA family protein n=1 Tax=Pedobacter sp. MC2016-15 TaxID=2994473 RepID=UPI0022452E78|nr:Gfo/Idh/MocA family oxidoreductase [Pedobacter sp. MC2016-15]MCX2481508.1 Gfo/Idh/MocA family oxidoreductase [Pedobacter sp. MC2016-15]
MSTYKKIEGRMRIVFLGCGAIAGQHAKRLSRLAGVDLFFASRDESKAHSYSVKYKGKGIFSSYTAAIQSPNIDVVFICTPPDSHLALSIAAMTAGKHVICEKPAFFHAADFDIIDQLRQEKGVQLFIAENYFYKPALRKLREVLAANIIGDIKFLFINATKTQHVDNWRLDTETAGGGALFEGGIHWINYISNLGLTLQSVTGFQPSKNSSPERSMQVVATYAEGAVGTLLYSWEVNTVFKGLRISRIFGTKGSILFESNGLYIFVRGKKWRLLLPGIADISGAKGMLTDFMHALRTGEDAAFNLPMARRDLEFVEQAYHTSAIHTK